MRAHLVMPMLLPCHPTSFGPSARDEGRRGKQHGGSNLLQRSCATLVSGRKP
jgi:hypothetical protein